MKQRLVQVRGRMAGGVRARLTGDLRRRIEELEDEVQECRRLNRRIAELTDLVEELLLPVDERDENLVRQRLDRYAAGL